jgi:hypothetical protein
MILDSRLTCLFISFFEQGWVHTSINGRFVPGLDPLLSSSSVFEISVTKTTEVYISVIQPKKRSNTRTKYWYCDSSMILMRAKGDCDGPYECVSCSLNGAVRQSHMEVFLEEGFKYFFMPWSCILSTMHSSNKPGDHCRRFALSTYSAAPVAMKPVSDVKNEGDAVLSKPVAERVRQLALWSLFSEIIPCNDGRLVFPIVEKSGNNYGLLMGIYGANQALCYFIALNGSSNHILSLRITIASGFVFDGMWVFTALNRGGQTTTSTWESQPQDFDIPPLSQQILFVVTSTGTQKGSKSLQSNPSFHYISSWVASRQQCDVPMCATSEANKTYLGSSVELCPAAYNALELLCSNTCINDTLKVCGSRGSIEISIENSTNLVGAAL